MMGVFALTPTGVTTMDSNDLSTLDYRIRIETHKGHHVVDSHGAYYERPISSSAPFFTGTNEEGR